MGRPQIITVTLVPVRTISNRNKLGQIVIQGSKPIIDPSSKSRKFTIVLMPPRMELFLRSMITVGGTSVPNTNFSLESGFVISGIVRDNNNDAMDGVGVCVHRTDGSFTGICGGTDANGYYETGGLPAGTDYVPYAIGYELGFKEQMWDHILGT